MCGTQDNYAPCRNGCVLDSDRRKIFNDVLNCANLPLLPKEEMIYSLCSRRKLKEEAAGGADTLTPDGLMQCLHAVGRAYTGRWNYYEGTIRPAFDDQTTFYDLCMWVNRHFKPRI